jgi:3-oxocholest-4-en-26-oyl-CoA dehydrogenase alpha subunit
MIIEYNADQRRFRDTVHEYMVATIMTADMADELKDHVYSKGGGPVYWRKMRQLGQDGWIAMSWPKELGGAGLDPVEQYILVEEAKRAGFPWPSLSANAIGPVLARHAAPSIRERVVGEILRGEVYLAIGYSEASAGSDLASLTTSARRDGDEWVINGQKIWTSNAHFARYIWLAARTDPDLSKRHKGLSVFLVPTDSPGFACTPIHTLGVDTNTTFYENVRVPADCLIGTLNGGWPLITGQLNVERLALAGHGHVSKLYEATLALLQGPGPYHALLKQSWVRRSMAAVHVRLEALRMLTLKAAWTMQLGASGMVESSVTKVYGSELYVEVGRRMGEILGSAANIAAGPDLVLDSLAEKWWRIATVHTIGGGANEVQRTIIATAGLGMPRPQ